MRLILSVFFILYGLSAHSQSDSLKLIFAGDIMQHGQQLSAAGPDDNGNYNYEPNYRFISPIISSADLAIGNLELTLAGPPYMGYPKFCAPDILAETLKKAGFDVLVTANNHSLDRRKQGLERTIDVLDELDMLHTGTFKTKAERDSLYPLIIEKNNFRIALLNYTYGTNGIPIQKPNVVNLIDTVAIKNDISKARKYSVDLIITFVHWGSEYRSLPNTTQKTLTRFLFREKVDLIIGSHPHVLQPIELWKDSLASDRLVAYSLGNFISNQRTRYRDGGILLEINLRKTNDKITIENAGYHLAWVYKLRKPIMQFHILPAAEYENDTTFLKYESDRSDFQQFLKDSRGLFGKFNMGVTEFTFQRPLLPKDTVTVLRIDEQIQQDSIVSNPKDLPEFYIQVFASSGRPDLGSLPEKWQEHLKIINENGINKYQLGPFNDADAQKVLQEIQTISEFKDAFLIRSQNP